MNYLFLYTELADYTLACLERLKSLHPEDNITVIHYPINPEAPFNFDFSGIGDFHNVKDFESYDLLFDFVKKVNPQKIVCSGWVNKWYLKICWNFRKKALCILTLDNHWLASPKQQVMKLIGSAILPKIFRKVWVPGTPQTRYAHKLGFHSTDIATGFYACDTERFLRLGNTWLPEKKKNYPKRILCVARYIPAKGYSELWKAFIEWHEEEPNDWELWCVGTGEEFNARAIHPKIKHLGFLQKNEWDSVIGRTGVFILPSHFEPWGVVVHEFAAAGYPLVLTDKVGAGEMFLTDENGWLVTSGNIKEIKSVFSRINASTTDELLRKAERSKELASCHSTNRWAETLSRF